MGPRDVPAGEGGLLAAVPLQQPFHDEMGADAVEVGPPVVEEGVVDVPHHGLDPVRAHGDESSPGRRR
ncbi:hypothetical protein ACIP44_21840 [Streptomyces diastaticus]|uniref:hypothetical protein n=1 Tax=Streptomyces diastaticus TaxID=1956 RepID=UPI00382DA846